MLNFKNAISVEFWHFEILSFFDEGTDMIIIT